MFGKDALKSKMAKAIHIHINVKDPEEEKSSDNAPTVHTPEPGVVKNTPNEQLSHNPGTGLHPAQAPGHILPGKLAEGSPQEEMGESPAMEAQEQASAAPGSVTNALMQHTAGGNPAGPGRTLDSIAHDRMQKKMNFKKGLKV